MSTDEQKRQFCQELALVLKAESIVEDFLVNTSTLVLPCDWEDAVDILRTSDGVEAIRKRMRAVMRAKEYREIVAYARRDADVLSLKEISEGRVAKHDTEVA